MMRGDVVTVALPGDFGKPRPALIVQSDLFAKHPSVTVLPITSEMRDAPLFRLALPAGDATGLQLPSQIMVDKIQTIRRTRIGQVLGKIDQRTMMSVHRALAVFLGFAE